MEIIPTWVVEDHPDKEVATIQIWEETWEEILEEMSAVLVDNQIEGETLEATLEANNKILNKWDRILLTEIFLQIKILRLEAIPYLEIHCLEKNDSEIR